MLHIGLSEKVLSQVANHLNLLLCNEYVLYTKTLKYHWNVEGPHFGPLHALFKDEYEQLLDIVDDVAERVRALGYKSLGTLHEFIAHATLKEDAGHYPHSQQMIKHLVVAHETIIKQIREDIDFTAEMKDMGTNNFLCDLIEKHEKMAWMLRSHLAEMSQ